MTTNHEEVGRRMQIVARRTPYTERRQNFVRAITWATLGLILIVAPRASLEARADQGWIGKRVIQKSRGFHLRLDNKVVDPRSVEFYRVQQIDGKRILLKAEGIGLSGWASIDDVVPVDEAIEFFTNRVRSSPRDVFSLEMRAKLWREKKELDAALADYDQAVRLNPKNPRAYIGRGILWVEKREYDKAIADFTEAARMEPKAEVTYVNRGNMWSIKREYDKPIADFDESIRLDPRNPRPYLERGNAWVMKHDLDKAIADFTEAVGLDSRFTAAFRSRGILWRRKKEFDKAIADFSKAIRLDPRDSLAHINRSNAWRDKGAYDKAIADLDEAIRLDPLNKNADYTKFYLRMRDEFQAKRPYVDRVLESAASGSENSEDARRDDRAP
jgi:tetratricopeptide (TPR) repeat protein